MKLKRISRRLSGYGSALYSRSPLPRIESWIYTRGRIDSVFVWIPKNAGQTVSIHLENTCGMQKLKTVEAIKTRYIAKGPYTFGHISLADLISQSLVGCEFLESAFVFAISRNPYTRFASLFNHHKKQRIIPEEATIEDLVRMVSSPRLTPVGLYNGKSLSMCNPQVRWLHGIEVDYFGSVENLASDLAVIQRRLSMASYPEETTGVQKHISASNSADVLNQFDSKVLKFIRDFYAEDFERFGYSKDFDDRLARPK